MSNRPELEIELTANSDLEKQQWMSNIQTIIEDAKSGTTPMGRILLQRAEKKAAQKKEETEKMKKEREKMEAEMKAKQEMARRASVAQKPSKAPALKDVPEERAPSPVVDDSEEYDNNAFEVQKQKIKVVFQNIDKDGNGKIDKDEFYGFTQGLGATIDRKESDLIFSIVDTDGNGSICFIEFYNYFVKFVLGETVLSGSEARLRAAFLEADKDGSGTVSFKNFAEYAMNRRRDLAMSRLLTAFDQLDKDQTGEISYNQFRDYFLREARASIRDLGLLGASSVKEEHAIEDMLRGMYNQADATEMADYLRQRWDKFTSFKRAGASGGTVMKGGHGMVDDRVPGEYTLIDLACFSDLPPIEPKHVVTKVTWIKSTVPGKSGRVIFPHEFDSKLPTVIATNETLAYYGASLADSNQLKVSLLYRHGIQDFTYENNYLEDYVLAEGALGGAGIEKHGFAHLDCPMDDDSGFFVMGKMEGDELHLTGFKIPTRHTLYVPPFTIHCNDYLRGTWRTMLSDEAEIDHVQLVKQQRQGKVEIYEKFQFSFEPLK